MTFNIKQISRLRGWSRKTVVRYVLLQIPSFVLILVILYFVSEPFQLPLWSILIVLLLWIVKDFVMFFFVWKAYIPSGGDDPAKMIGKTGITSEELDPAGYAKIGGELWYAEKIDKGQEVKSGSRIIVRENHGLTLFVEKYEQDDEL